MLRTALLDTGAEICIISREIFSTLSLPLINRMGEIKFPNGETYVGQTVVDFVLMIGALEEVYLSAIVFDDRRWPIILGMPWFNEVEFTYQPHGKKGSRLQIDSR